MGGNALTDSNGFSNGDNEYIGGDSKAEWEPNVIAAIPDECITDKDNLCGDVQPGEHRTHKCLESQIAKASPECQDAWKRGIIGRPHSKDEDESQQYAGGDGLLRIPSESDDI